MNSNKSAHTQTRCIEHLAFRALTLKSYMVQTTGSEG